MKHKIWTGLTAFLIFSNVGVAYCYADILREGKIYQSNESIYRSLEANDNSQKTIRDIVGIILRNQLTLNRKRLDPWSI